MYIKLGSTNINYVSPKTDNYMIFSEIVDSSLSYYRPVLVHTKEELAIWFGDDFSDREYFMQLLDSGITLYLYRPIDSKQDNTSSDFIDYSSYEIDDYLYSSVDELIDKNTEGGNVVLRGNKIFNIITDGGNYKNSENITYTTYIHINETSIKLDKLLTNKDNIFDLLELVDIDKLPQNLEFISNSLNNRDTLVLFKSRRKVDGGDEYKYNYISPSFNNSEDSLFNTSEVYHENDDLFTIDYDRVSSDYLTTAFKLNIGDNLLIENLQYLVITTKVGGNYQYKAYIFTTGTTDITTTSIYNQIKDSIGDSNITVVKISEIKGNEKSYLISLFKDLGYTYNSSDNILTYPYLIPVNYFYNINNFSMTPEFSMTNDQLYSRVIDNEDQQLLISFYSKTIGTGGKLGNIKVTIEKIEEDVEKPENDVYRIRIERFEYYEVYEGGLFGSVTLPSIDYLINRRSKLVECLLYPTEVKELPEGSWYLRGGKKENYGPDNYMKSLESLFNPPEPIYFDYLLIPNIKKFISPNSNRKDQYHYLEYETILNYSKEIGNQVLIQNLDNWENIIETDEEPDIKQENTLYKIGDKRYAIIDGSWAELVDRDLIAENTYLFNYTEDKDNRLIYFYKDMEVYGKKRPGYYLYLHDLLFNDRYSPSANYISYDSPIPKDEYNDGLATIEKDLIKYKCNYLVENNHIYYYKKYQDGVSYNSTGWMRFCLGKISRELTKKKWWILSDNDIGKIRDRILSILAKISNSFSIIREIDLYNYKIDYIEQTIELTIDTSISDLVNNNIRIDLTLNYNT